MRRVVSGKDVLAEGVVDNAGQLACTAVISAGTEKRRCGVLIQRTADGDLVDGVRAHYQMVHPERKIR